MLDVEGLLATSGFMVAPVTAVVWPGIVGLLVCNATRIMSLEQTNRERTFVAFRRPIVRSISPIILMMINKMPKISPFNTVIAASVSPR